MFKLERENHWCYHRWSFKYDRSHVRVATQIQRAANDGFFRIWCAAHQLDLVMQERFKSMFNECFVHVIQGITGHLRRQKNLIQKMKATCPHFIDTWWLSMGHLLN